MKNTLLDRELARALGPLRSALIDHPLYSRLGDEAALLRFMEQHVFAVWDFMSLVKALQQRLTCTSVPWLPTESPIERRFLNEIVLDEESDFDAQGRPTSHFEMYVEAMHAAGADTTSIARFVEVLRSGGGVATALAVAGAGPGARRFVETTLDFAKGDDVSLAAAFAYGRELVIPPMFQELVAKLLDREPERFAPLAFYLQRHIEADGENHGPIAEELVARLVADDPRRRALAVQAAQRSLEARIALWDDVVRSLDVSGTPAQAQGLAASPFLAAP